MATMMEAAWKDDNLFSRIGGAAAVDAAVDIFYRRVLADPSVSHFFTTTDMVAQRAKQKAFLTMVFGGPNDYAGRDMRDAHRRLVDAGMNERHFDAVTGHLQATLDEIGVGDADAREVMALAGGTRDDVLCR